MAHKIAEIVLIDSWQAAKEYGNIYYNAPNQIRRAIGAFETTYTGNQCGTVKTTEMSFLNGEIVQQTKYYDWWLTDEEISPGWKLVKILPAN